MDVVCLVSDVGAPDAGGVAVLVLVYPRQNSPPRICLFSNYKPMALFALGLVMRIHLLHWGRIVIWGTLSVS